MNNNDDRWHPNIDQAIPLPGADNDDLFELEMQNIMEAIAAAGQVPSALIEYEFTEADALSYLQDLPEATYIERLTFKVDLRERGWLDYFMAQRCRLSKFNCTWKSNDIPIKPGWKKVVVSGEAGKLAQILRDIESADRMI